MDHHSLGNRASGAQPSWKALLTADKENQDTSKDICYDSYIKNRIAKLRERHTTIKEKQTFTVVELAGVLCFIQLKRC